MEAAVCCDATTFAPGATDSSMTSYTVGDSMYSYDDAGRLFQLDHDLNGAGDTTYTWTYDELSRVKTFTNTGHTSENATYTYDDIGQLTDATFDGGPDDEGYEYDAAGNRAEVNGMITYQTDPYNRLTNDGYFTYLYDGEGNVIARYEDTSAGNGLDSGDTNITDYAYDHRNRLVSVSTRATYASSPVPVAEYSYDPFDRRIATTYPGESSTRELYVYDRDKVLLDFVDFDTEDEVAPVISRRYLNGPALSGAAVDQVLAQEDIDEEGDPIGAVWLLTDHQGTTRDVVAYDTDVADETSVAMHFSYTAYGQPLSGDTSLTRFLYAGLQYEAASGLHFSATRTYDPVTARWNSPDWIGIKGRDANFYRYVGNNPTNGTDPNGLWVWPLDPNASWHPMDTLGLWTGIQGFGVEGGVQGEGGAIVGTSAQGSVGAGYFHEGGGGTFASGGAFAGSPNGGCSAVQNPNPAAPENPGTVVGASAGIGGGVFLTNASTVQQLGGPFATVTVTVGIFTVQVSSANDANGVTWFGSLSVSKGIGLSASAYPTTTITR
jgi:RHS repeat-associated protein